MPKGSSVPTENSSLLNDVSKFFAQFPISGSGIDSLVTWQRRNYEAITKATQLTAESFNVVLHRQVAIAGQATEDGTNGIRQLLSPGTPKEKMALQTDLMKTTIEKNLAGLRELSDILGKATAEATDVLTKRVSDGITELNRAAAIAEPNGATTKVENS
jgi:phasin family protein